MFGIMEVELVVSSYLPVCITLVIFLPLYTLQNNLIYRYITTL
jgi:uncharacterized membrane protein